MATGKVTSNGKITAKNIITGMKIEGEVDAETLRAALETMKDLDTGEVSGDKGVQAAGDIVTGFQYTNQAQFSSALDELRRELQAVIQTPNAPAEAQDALESLDEAIAETKKDEPRAKRLINRLKETVEFITDAGKAIDSASKAGPLIVKAIPIALGLYQAAQALF